MDGGAKRNTGVGMMIHDSSSMLMRLNHGKPTNCTPLKLGKHG